MLRTERVLYQRKDLGGNKLNCVSCADTAFRRIMTGCRENTRLFIPHQFATTTVCLEQLYSVCISIIVYYLSSYILVRCFFKHLRTHSGNRRLEGEKEKQKYSHETALPTSWGPMKQVSSPIGDSYRQKGLSESKEPVLVSHRL